MNNTTALQIAIQANVPVIWWGPPGVGKTYFLIALAKALEWPMEVVITSICEPSDLGGLPVIDNGGVRRIAPGWAKRLADCTNGILFGDELSTAPPANQAGLLRIAQRDPDGYRWVGDTRLNPGVRFVGAANPPEQAAGGWDFSAPLANRFYHDYWASDTDGWIKGLRTGFESPLILRLPEDPDWHDEIPIWRSHVASFIRARPNLLLQVPKEESSMGKAWPSPRTWDMAATLLAASWSFGQNVQLQLLSGSVGDGAAAEFVNWFTHLDLPTPQELLENPKKYYKKPNDHEEHKGFAMLSAVCTLVREAPTVDNWNKLWAVLVHAAKWHPDVVYAFVVEIAEEIRPRVEGHVTVPEPAKALIRRIAKQSDLLKDLEK